MTARFSGTSVRLGWAITAAAALAIAVLTLRPGADLTARVPFVCILCGQFGLVDVALNILLFVPLGFGLRLSLRRPWVSLAVVAGVSAVIELVQGTVVPGRYASLHDLLANGLGGIIGMAMASHWRALVFAARRQAAVLCVLSALAWVGVVVASSWAVAVSLPHGDYRWRLAPTLRGFERFRGEVLDVRLEGAQVSVADGDLVDARDGLSAGTRILVTFRPSSPSLRLAPIARLNDARGNQVLTVGQDGRDIVLSVAMHANPLRLRAPSLRIEDVVPEGREELFPPIVARASAANGMLALEVDDGARRQRTLALTGAIGWSLMLPTPFVLGAGTAVISAAWLALLAFPVAYWTGFATVRSPELSRNGRLLMAFVPVLGIVVGLAVVPMVMNTPFVSVIEWSGAIAGLCLGLLTSRLMVARRGQ